MNALEGQVALVTGGRSGIGLACCQQLAEAGARVFTAQRGQAEAFESISADLGDPAAPRQILDQIIAEAGRLDILINNAGVMEEGTVEETSLDDWQHTLAINLTAPFLLIKEALPHLRKTGGRIVNVGSVEGIGSNPRHPAYCASKGGLHALTRAVAVDHGNEGVRCNAVAPGWIDTDLNEAFIESMPEPEAFRANLKTIHPVGRTGSPDDIAALVTWLASPASAFITGQVLVADGGRTIKLSLP